MMQDPKMDAYGEVCGAFIPQEQKDTRIGVPPNGRACDHIANGKIGTYLPIHIIVVSATIMTR